MFSASILSPDVKNSIYSVAGDNSNTSTDSPESEADLPDFSTLRPFDMDPRKKVSNKNYT